MGHNPDEEHFLPNACPKPAPRPKKDPKPLKRTALKKKPYRINQETAKQKAVKAAYDKVKREVYENTPDICSGCGRYGYISCSHIVSQAKMKGETDNPRNFTRQCLGNGNCHDNTERGKYFTLLNGLDLLERLWSEFGEMGRQRFWKVYYQWEENRDLWKHSRFFDPDVHD